MKYNEKSGGRQHIEATLPAVVRSHYDDINRIAEDMKALGYVKAAAILAERMPRSSRARSGELGEILATELVEEQLGYRVPVRRLRYKDGREMAMGEDFIGVSEANTALRFAKGESKSRVSLTSATVSEARNVLSRDAGRPTPASILFISDRLLERGGAEETLGRAIRNEIANKAIPIAHIEHVLFTVSGNAAPKALVDDLASASAGRPHTVIHVQITDHQAFIKAAFERH